jgi:hypothetical protein
MGLPQDPRRTGRPGSKDSGVDGTGDPEERRNRPRAAADRASLVPILRPPAEAVLACDFFTVDLLDGTQAYVLAVIEHATRRICILGVTQHPTGEWTTQQARNLLMDLGEQPPRVKFMIRGRGSNFTAAFDAVLADAGIRTVLCNVRTPRMNAIAERWIGGCRRELLDLALVWNQAHLRRILRDYETHHNQHRPLRSLHGAAPLKPLPEPVDLTQCRVRRQPRVSGLISEYRLVAWRGRGFGTQAPTAGVRTRQQRGVRRWRNPSRPLIPGMTGDHALAGYWANARKKSHLRRLRSFQDVPGRRLGESPAPCDRCLGAGAQTGRASRENSLGLGP